MFLVVCLAVHRFNCVRVFAVVCLACFVSVFSCCSGNLYVVVCVGGFRLMVVDFICVC